MGAGGGGGEAQRQGQCSNLPAFLIEPFPPDKHLDDGRGCHIGSWEEGEWGGKWSPPASWVLTSCPCWDLGGSQARMGSEDWGGGKGFPAPSQDKAASATVKMLVQGIGGQKPLCHMGLAWLPAKP